LQRDVDESVVEGELDEGDSEEKVEFDTGDSVDEEFTGGDSDEKVTAVEKLAVGELDSVELVGDMGFEVSTPISC